MPKNKTTCRDTFCTDIITNFHYPMNPEILFAASYPIS
jgi:hypothetical protein